MPENRIEDRLAELREKIHYHNHRYFVLDDPLIEDSKFDELMVELSDLENRHPELIVANSPTQRVGGGPSKGFSHVEHGIPMLSLANVFSYAELEAWHKRIIGSLDVDSIEMVCELKIDGLAVSLTYQDGSLIEGATRGDGNVGEKVTANLRTIKSIPLMLLNSISGVLEVRGEVYIPTEEFHKLNNERIELGIPTYANPRNTAAGSIRQLDSNITSSRNLDIMVYGLGLVETDNTPVSHWETLQMLRDLGFKVSLHNIWCDTLGDIQEYHELWQERRYSLPYAVDGIVIKVNSMEFREQLGISGREPRWAVAYKFPAQRAVTKLLDIKINVGRTGSLNPFAVLDPVVVSGATLKMATLHNFDDIQRKDIRIGDWVVIERAGDVIPKIIGPVLDRRSGNEKIFEMPDKCPACQSNVANPENETTYRCSNPGCSAQFYELFKHFVSKGAMDIDGLGESWCRLLIAKGLVKELSDIFILSKEKLLLLERVGEKLAKKIMDNIDKSKQRHPSRLLFALGILHVGSDVASLLIEHFGDIDKLSCATKEELTTIPGIGTKIADSIIQYFSLEANRMQISKLRMFGLTLVSPGELVDVSSLPLAGQTFSFTGGLENMSRSDAENSIKQLGGKTSTMVTSKTTYLVVGGSPGSKLEVAKRIGVKIIDEDYLNILLAG